MMKFIVSFSGGKDSMLAMHRMIIDNNKCLGIFTTTNEDKGSWFHDIEIDILKEIAVLLEVPFFQFKLDGTNYTDEFVENILNLKRNMDFDSIVFGDIDIINHRTWCEEVCSKADVKAIFPLWNENRDKLVKEFIDLGYKAIIKRIDKKKLDIDVLGKVLDYDILKQFEEKNIDLCGENGEYHTLVFDGPLFKNKLSLKMRDTIESENTFSLNIELDKVL